MKSRISVAATVAVLAAMTGGSGVAAALPAADPPPEESWGLIASPPLPDGSYKVVNPRGDIEIPDSVRDGVWRLGYEGALDNVNAVVWDAEAGQLEFYSTSAPDSLAVTITEHLPAEAFRIVPAANSRTAIDTALQQIAKVGGQIAPDARVVTAYAPPLADELILSVEGDLTSASSGARELLDGSGTSIPVRVEKAADVTPAWRNVSSTSYRFAGAVMRTTTASGSRFCSTGFLIGELSTGDKGMISADHCGTGTTNHWYYSTSLSSPAQIAPYSGMLTISPYTFDMGVWEGAGTTSFYAYTFSGDYQDVATLSAIKGAANPIVNDEVCYSGSYSGHVCDNVVTATGVLVCYSPTMCYQGQSFTSQQNGIPAAGNGDSGGPVYTIATGGVRAAGIISGIVSGTPTCTGEPGSAASDEIGRAHV